MEELTEYELKLGWAFKDASMDHAGDTIKDQE